MTEPTSTKPTPGGPRAALDVAFVASAAVATAWNDLSPGHAAVAVKLAPMAILIARLARALRSGEVEPRMGTALLFGLAASTIGDVVLPYRFVGGLGAFLVAHLAYLVAMGRPQDRASSHALAAAPALVVWAAMAWILVGGQRVPRPLLGPVVVYMTVICAMLARALGRALVDVRSPASRVFAAGAAVFVASDALIALSRWVVAIPHPRVAVLVTYYLAQRLLFAGVEAPGLAPAERRRRRRRAAW